MKDIRKRSFEGEAERLLKSIGEAQGTCQHIPAGEGVDATKLRQGCSLIPDAATTLAQTSKDVGDSYDTLEKAWLKQRSEHVTLLKQSEAFQKQYALRR